MQCPSHWPQSMIGTPFFVCSGSSCGDGGGGARKFLCVLHTPMQEEQLERDEGRSWEGAGSGWD